MLNHYLRYFFHATSARKETDEYNAGDSDTEEDCSPPPASPIASDSRSGTLGQRASSEGKEQARQSQIDPSMAEWFDIGAKSRTATSQESETESETEPEPDEPEPDSENEDVKPEAETEAGFDDDDWERIDKESDTQSQPKASDSKVGMIFVCIPSTLTFACRVRSRTRMITSGWARRTMQCTTTRSTSSSICEHGTFILIGVF